MLELTCRSIVDLDHSSIIHGAGLFETIRIQNGAPRWLDLHLERMAAGCAYFGLEPPPPSASVWNFLLHQTPLSGLPLGGLRLIAVDRTLLVQIFPFPAPPPLQTALGISETVRRLTTSALCRFKTTSYLENRFIQQEANRRGLFDCAALNEHGRLADGGRSNLFLITAGRAFTPPTSEGALPGIARRVLLDSGLATERPLPPKDIDAAEGIFWANALRGVIPVKTDPEGVWEICGRALE